MATKAASPDWDWPPKQHAVLERAAEIIADGVGEARAGIIDRRLGRTMVYSAGARIIAQRELWA